MSYLRHRHVVLATPSCRTYDIQFHFSVLAVSDETSLTQYRPESQIDYRSVNDHSEEYFPAIRV